MKTLCVLLKPITDFIFNSGKFINISNCLCQLLVRYMEMCGSKCLSAFVYSVLTDNYGLYTSSRKPSMIGTFVCVRPFPLSICYIAAYNIETGSVLFPLCW